jgi:hypothetical protein
MNRSKDRNYFATVMVINKKLTSNEKKAFIYELYLKTAEKYYTSEPYVEFENFIIAQ